MKWKKKFLAATLSAVFASGCAGPRIRQDDNIAGENAGAAKGPLSALLRHSAPKKFPFLILGDTDHADTRLYEFLARDDVMAGLAAKGYKNLFLETRREFQDIADKVAKNEITPEQYARTKLNALLDAGVDMAAAGAVFDRAEIEAKVIQSAARHGIRAYLAEGQEKNLEDHVILVKNLRNSDAAVAYRAAGDAELADFIKEKAAGQASVVFYGAAHGSFKCDIDEYLGGQKIHLYADQRAADNVPALLHEERGALADSIVLDSAKFIGGAEMERGVKNAKQVPEAQSVNARLECRRL